MQYQNNLCHNLYIYSHIIYILEVQYTINFLTIFALIIKWRKKNIVKYMNVVKSS